MRVLPPPTPASQGSTQLQPHPLLLPLPLPATTCCPCWAEVHLGEVHMGEVHLAPLVALVLVLLLLLLLVLVWMLSAVPWCLSHREASSHSSECTCGDDRPFENHKRVQFDRPYRTKPSPPKITNLHKYPQCKESECCDARDHVHVREAVAPSMPHHRCLGCGCAPAVVPVSIAVVPFSLVDISPALGGQFQLGNFQGNQ